MEGDDNSDVFAEQAIPLVEFNPKKNCKQSFFFILNAFDRITDSL